MLLIEHLFRVHSVDSSMLPSDAGNKEKYYIDLFLFRDV